jgi:hypothetical protein
VYPSRAEYLRRWVKIEMGGRADVEPAADAVIMPFAPEAFPNLLSDAEVNVHALLPMRTFWEKVMMLYEDFTVGTHPMIPRICYTR